MPSTMLWGHMAKYRRKYNLQYLDIMRNSGYDIKFKLELRGSFYGITVYVNDARMFHRAMYGWTSRQVPHGKLRNAVEHAINELLNATPERIEYHLNKIKEDNSSEQSKTNQQHPPTNRDGGVRVVEEGRATNSGPESTRNKQTTFGLYVRRADDCISAALNSKHVRNTMVGMVQAGQCIRRRVAILANGKRR